jgi:hypothetical protein
MQSAVARLTPPDPDNRSGELDDDEGEEVAASIRKQLEEESRARL